MPRFVCPVIHEKTTSARAGEIFSLYFYDGYSGDAAYTYSDNALTIANANPVESDEYGVFPDIFLASRANGYRVEMRDSNGGLIWNKSEVYGSAQAPSDVGASRGVVWMFYGTYAGAGNDLDVMLADGWSIADGTAGFNGDITPDLTGAFTRLVTSVFDITDVSAGASTVTLTGTVDGHALTIDEIPSHTHATGDSKYVYQLTEESDTTNKRPINSGTNANKRYGEHLPVGNDETHTHTLSFAAYSSEPAYVKLLPLIYGY